MSKLQNINNTADSEEEVFIFKKTKTVKLQLLTKKIQHLSCKRCLN